MQIQLPAIETLSLAQQVAQMLVVRASGHLFDSQIQYPHWEPPAAQLRDWLHQGVGGVILLGGSAAELALRTQQLQSWASLPLLLAADVEEGVGQRFAGASWLPPPMALSAMADPSAALAAAQQMGAVTAQEAHAIGLNWVLGPVVDVNNNRANPVINVRAFGETPDRVSELASAFIRGVHQFPILTAAKHFPGHGDTAVDSHLDLPVLPHPRDRLEQLEWPPFQAAIAAGVDAIMSAHLLIPALDATHPATLSPSSLHILRHDLGFRGLIVTDALVMGAIADRYGPTEAAVLAVAAGADILLMPADPMGAIAAICAAIAAGRIAASQIRASVERIWRVKQTVAVPRTDSPGAALTAGLAQPAATALTANILQASQRLHRPVPIGEPGGSRRTVIVVDRVLDCDFLTPQSPAIAQPAARGYSPLLIDGQQPLALSDREVPTLLQLFIRGNPFRGSAGLTYTAHAWLQHLLATGTLEALVVYGSPYVLDKFLPLLPPDLPYGFTYGQMPAAQAQILTALLGDD